MQGFRTFMEAGTIAVTNDGREFKAWLGTTKVGQAYISQIRPGEYILHNIDIEEDYQRNGYGTQLMMAIAKYLRSVGAHSLNSSNEGSGTVQMLDKVFGRKNVQHYSGGGKISFDDAKHIMDVKYGYTRSEAKIRRRKLNLDDE